MPRISLEPYVRKEYDDAQMIEIARILEDVINRAFEGRIYQHYSAAAAPTGATVSWQVGDEVWNSTPTELGGAGSKYIIRGWKCIGAGAPGIWREMRFLTGN
jgi:hypothetical protein